MDAWLFAVVSSDKQVDTLPDQEAWAKRTARENGWTITRTFKDTSTGRDGARKLLDTMIDALRGLKKSQRPARVLMTRLDRLGRGDSLDPIGKFAEIRTLGPIIHTREDGDNAINRASDAIKPILRVLTGALENEARSDKSRASHAKRRAEGKHAGHAPYGVRLKEGKPVPDGARARVVRKVFEMRATGAGYERIAHAVGPTAPPKPLVDGSTRKIGWHRTFVRTMLACKTYKGVVIDADLWDRVQLVKNPDFKDRGTQRFPWPLSGVVKCTCGYGLTGAASGGNCQRCNKGQRRHNHQRIRYYLCNNPIAHPGKRPHLRADRLEAEFVDLLCRLAAKPSLVDVYRRKSGPDLGELRSQLRDLEHDLESVDARRRAAFDLQATGAIPAEDLAQRLAELRAERDPLEQNIATIQRTISVVTAESSVQRDGAARLRRLAKLWPGGDAFTQKEAARLIATALGGLRIDNDTHLQPGRNGFSGNNLEQSFTIPASRQLAELDRILALDGVLSARTALAVVAH